jgi:hypothetical protein
MNGGMKNGERPSLEKTTQGRNVYKKELEQTKNNTRKRENRLISFVKEKKKQWLNNRIQQVEEAHKQNETRRFFKDIQTFQNDRSPPIFTCKDENAILKTDKQEVLNRWRQYFADLMKNDKKTENQVQAEHISGNEIEIEPPTYKKVSDLIEKN